MSAAGIATARIGSQVPLCYGPVIATGMRAIDHSDVNGKQYGIWLLGDGEWAGPSAFWLNNSLMYFRNHGSLVAAGGPGGNVTLRFHRGADTPLNASSDPSSTAGPDGGDQLVDPIFNSLPSFINRLPYSRIAYYTIEWTPPAGSSNTAMQPIGQWRTTLCRTFDANGNQTNYTYTTNPAWHFVDSWLRLAIKPEYNITRLPGSVESNAPDFLTKAERDCFDWESIYDAATYFDELVNGRPRFQGSYAFASQTTLAAIHEQILLCCRSYQQEYAGKISLYCDRPRPSMFVMSGKHLLPQTFSVDEKQVHQNANKYVGKFLDMELPIVATVASVVLTPDPANSLVADAVLQIDGPNPVVVGDVVFLGGSDNGTADGFYICNAVNGNTVNASSAFPGGAPSGNFGGGYIGYPQSRFAQRALEGVHDQHALASGRIPNLATPRRRMPTVLDYANCTGDQVARLLAYEQMRDLGSDGPGWIAPKTVTVQLWSESVDQAWSILKKLPNGSRITIDPSASYEYQGDYEMMEKEYWPFQSDAGQAGSEPIVGPDQNSGRLKLVLRTYNEAALKDVYVPLDGGCMTVPNSSI